MADRPAVHKGVGRLYDLPYVLMIMPPLFWSGNFILGRAVAGHVPPIGLAFWRWFGGGLILLPFAWRHLARDWPKLWARRGVVALLSLTGIAVFNTFVYIGLGTTTALNGVMMQSTMPVLIVLASFALFGERVGPVASLGIALSLTGALTIIARGDVQVLAALDLKSGDLWIFAACLSYALYTALLRLRPSCHPLSFLFVSFWLGAAMLAPLYAWEGVGEGRPMLLDLPTLGAVLYVCVFPSILAYLCFNRTVELIGANRTGLSIHLMPAFGSLLAIGLLGERPHWYHGAGIALIFVGIVLANRRRR